MVNVDINGDYSTFSPELLTLKDEKFEDFVFGNVYDSLIGEIYNSDKFLRIYSEIIQGLRNCQETCYYFSLCGGGSPSNKLAEHRDFKATETYFCKYRIKEIVDLILPKIEKSLIDK